MECGNSRQKKHGFVKRGCEMYVKCMNGGWGYPYRIDGFMMFYGSWYNMDVYR